MGFFNQYESALCFRADHKSLMFTTYLVHCFWNSSSGGMDIYMNKENKHKAITIIYF